MDSFVIYIGVKGKMYISTEAGQPLLEQGQTTLLPAAVDLVSLKSEDAEILEVYI